MERQPVVMGLPGTHISCLAFTLLPSPGCLIIYLWYDNLPHDLFHKQRWRETAGERDGERVKRNARKAPQLNSTTHRDSFPSHGFREKLQEYLLFVLHFQLFTQRTQQPVFAFVCVNTLHLCEYS